MNLPEVPTNEIFPEVPRNKIDLNLKRNTYQLMDKVKGKKQRNVEEHNAKFMNVYRDKPNHLENKLRDIRNNNDDDYLEEQFKDINLSHNYTRKRSKSPGPPPKPPKPSKKGGKKIQKRKKTIRRRRNKKNNTYIKIR